MPSTPAWLAATSGFAGAAGQVNQFLGTHAIQYLYTGTLQANHVVAGSGSADSNGLWIAQSFTTAAGQTTTGYVILTAQITGAPGPWTISLQANSGSAPSGTPLVSVTVPKEFLSSLANTTVMVPVPATGLTASTQYWIVTEAAGDASDFYAWNKSNQTSGASTSVNGTSWTAQAYGLMFEVFDQSMVLPVAGTWEDSGARWTTIGYSSGAPSALREYTAGQAPAGYTASSRALTYSGSYLTKVA